jgi:iron complex outermembrane receptor protein
MTQEFRWNSAPSKKGPLDWTAGSYFFLQENPNKQATHFGKDAALLGAPMTDFATINTTKGTNRGVAFYGQANYKLTDKLTLTGGLRFDHESKQLSVTGAFQPDGSPAFVTQPDTSASIRYTALSPKLGLSFTASANSLIYLSYARGYRTGGLTQLSSDPSQPPLYPYQPEYSNNLELGIKNNWLNNKLRLNISIFATTVSQVQVPTLVLPDAITVIRNTGKLNSKGAELELVATALKGLQVEFMQGFTSAKYGSLELSQNGAAVNLKGKKQLFTPDNTSLLALQYSLASNPKKPIRYTARLEWKRLGGQYFDLGNQIRQSAYSLINIRAGFSIKQLDFYCWGRNLTNKKYISSAYAFGAVHLGAPLTMGTTLALRL